MRNLGMLSAWIGLVLATSALAAEMSEERKRLIGQIQAEVLATAGELGFARLSPAVEAALLKVERHAFVPAPRRDLAYLNSPLPIGSGQTISQPYIVAIMSQLLGVGPGDKVFELGTGSGYQAAILAAMGVEVYTVEIVPELAEQASKTLASLGYDRVHVRSGDGWQGWPEAAPFDGIIVTAAAPRIPQPLVDQLAADGRLVIPMGAPDRIQQLALFSKDEHGALVRENLLPVRFVPVTGAMGQ
ncbi:protein-L-isoaspartate(D-aspartate) O-methyltransferase [Thiorhodococcus mannitoliphagus]|uniref:Protein-L-isoaspartate O-methyltransferase n=2 Tax=Thiorhodococcus mannitoliphagus TaxID=329406 RepID=A0A6P1DUG3_9GAMM|nr:protein-L-isoaspartate(D-aspartate) O-methyltransferase [Thiorhodococcus mannitoliphagus]